MASTSRGRDGWEDGTSREDGPALTTYLHYSGLDRTRKQAIQYGRIVRRISATFSLFYVTDMRSYFRVKTHYVIFMVAQRF